jgi:hypothetical protein
MTNTFKPGDAVIFTGLVNVSDFPENPAMPPELRHAVLEAFKALEGIRGHFVGELGCHYYFIMADPDENAWRRGIETAKPEDIMADPTRSPETDMDARLKDYCKNFSEGDPVLVKTYSGGERRCIVAEQFCRGAERLCRIVDENSKSVMVGYIESNALRLDRVRYNQTRAAGATEPGGVQ